MFDRILNMPMESQTSCYRKEYEKKTVQKRKMEELYIKRSNWSMKIRKKQLKSSVTTYNHLQTYNYLQIYIKTPKA